MKLENLKVFSVKNVIAKESRSFRIRSWRETTERMKGTGRTALKHGNSQNKHHYDGERIYHDIFKTLVKTQI